MSTINVNASETITGRFASARLHTAIHLRFERSAAAALPVVAITVLSVVAVLAQQVAPPPAQQAPPAAPVAPAPAAPAAPSPPSPAIAGWQQALVAHLGRFQRYPGQARGAQGLVTVAVRVDRQGNIVSSRIMKTSGSAVLDADALAMIKRAAPLPPPPTGIADDDLAIVVPVHYAAGE